MNEALTLHFNDRLFIKMSLPMREIYITEAGNLVNGHQSC